MLYLHIGTDKTGSTAIQKLLHWNRAQLLEDGLCYPMSGLMHYDHARLKLALDNNDRKPWDALAEELAAHPGKDVVLSHEGFYNLRGEQLQRLREWLPAGPIRVILYLRRQDDMIESGILQQLKTREVIPDLDAFESGEMPWWPHLDYADVVARWGETFGRDNLLLRPYGRAYLPDEKAIYRDFLAGIDRDPEMLGKLDIPGRDPNPSLDAASASALVFLHRLGLKAEQHDSATDLLLHYQQRQGRSEARLFSLEQRRALLDKYADGNRRLTGFPAGLFSLEGEAPAGKPQDDDVKARLAFIYDSRRYLTGCPEWYGEAGFVHLVRSGHLRLLEGFYPLEDWGAWMRGGQVARMVFRVPRTMQGNLELTLNVHYLKGAKTQTRVRSVGGDWQVLAPDTRLMIRSTIYENQMGLVFLEFEHVSPASPIDLGLSDNDSRSMGAGVVKLRYREFSA